MKFELEVVMTTKRDYFVYPRSVHENIIVARKLI